MSISSRYVKCSYVGEPGDERFAYTSARNKPQHIRLYMCRYRWLCFLAQQPVICLFVDESIIVSCWISMHNVYGRCFATRDFPGIAFCVVLFWCWWSACMFSIFWISVNWSCAICVWELLVCNPRGECLNASPDLADQIIFEFEI